MLTYWTSIVNQLPHWLTEALGLSRHSNTWGTLGTQGTQEFEGHLSTQALKTFWHLGTWSTRALEGHLGTRALKARGQLASQALGHSGKALYLANSFEHEGNSNLKFMISFQLLKIRTVTPYCTALTDIFKKQRSVTLLSN